jgi:hypothetical protein
MFLTSYAMFLLAEQDRMQDLFRAFRATQAREGSEEVAYGLLILAGLLIVVLFLSMVIRQRRQREGYASPVRLFLNLCRAHKLKWRDRWLLWRLARMEQLDEPARLFLEPHWFASGGLPGELQQHAARLKSIHDRIFADVIEHLKLSDERQSKAAKSLEPSGAALPALKDAPDLDIAPWSARAFPSPLPPFSSTSDGAPV